MAGSFELKKSRGQFRFNLKATNGKVILTSAGYKNKRSAISGIDAVRKYARKTDQYDRRTAQDGYPYFILRSNRGQIIGRSDKYTRNTAMENGITSVRRNAPRARIDDLT